MATQKDNLMNMGFDDDDTSEQDQNVPLVSIIVPIYKVAPYVRKCLRSVASQTYRNFELILVNDATPDNSMDIAKRVSSDIPNRKIIDLDRNGGLGNARNVGIEAATGKYIFLLDSDDWLADDALEKAVSKAERGNADVTVFNFYRVNFSKVSIGGNPVRFSLAALPSIDPLTDVDVFYIFNLAQIKLYNRSFIKSHGFRFETGVIYEDMDWHFKVLSSAARVAILDDPIYYYRVGRPGSILSSRGRQHFDLLKQIELAFAFVKENEKDAALEPLYSFAINAVHGILLRSRRIRKRHRREFFLKASHILKSAKGGAHYDLNWPEFSQFEDALLSGNYPRYCLWRLKGWGRSKVPAKLLKLSRKGKKGAKWLITKIRLSGSENLVDSDRFDILFESYWGQQFSDSPKYLYQFFKENFPDIKCGYVLNSEVAADVPASDRVDRGSKSFKRAVRSSSVLVNNNNFPELQRPKNASRQLHIQTFHGIPIKKIGVDVIGTIEGRYKENFDALVRRSQRWDYLVTAGAYHSEILRQAFEVNPKTIEIGSPRTDPLQDPGYRSAWRSKIRSQFGIDQDAKLVLYAPTWRESGSNPFLSAEELSAINAGISGASAVMVRAHHYSSFSNAMSDTIVDVSDYADSQELLAAADLIITDYSSIAYDFATTGNVPLFYIPDYEEFSVRRGVYFDLPEELGPLVCRSIDDLISKTETYLTDTERQKMDNHSFLDKFMEAERPDSCAVLAEEVIMPFLQNG